MNRSEFIKERKDTWIELGLLINKTKYSSVSTDENFLLKLIRNYRKTLADLSIARTFFKNDPLLKELNILICNTLNFLGINYHSNRNRIIKFYNQSLPKAILNIRFFFFISVAIFMSSALFGFFITYIDSFFANALIGDQYVYMTLDNIQKGVPFDVYQSKFQYIMSSYILANNIKVSFLAFASGIFYGVGTMLLLIFNGLMLGSVAAIFFNFNLGGDFIATVMVHGTLELFAIMVAGGAGLKLGQSIFKPGKQTRLEALGSFGKEAFIIVIAMVPVLIIAGFLEGYVTPLNLSINIRLLIIGLSSLLLAAYVMLPLFNYWSSRTSIVAAKPSIKITH